jgi:UDP-glucose 4-epimerase
MKKYKIRRMDDQNVLIIGGLGFMGSNLAHQLVDLGANVAIYDACLDPYGWNYANIKEIKDEVDVIVGDTRDFETLKTHVKDKDYIFNYAAQVSHNLSMQNPLLDIDINCTGNMSILEACRQVNDDVKIVYAGTRGQIGDAQYLPVDEKHPDTPPDLNGINKLAAEKYHLLYTKVYGIPTTSIRVGNTYGPRHQMKHGQYGVLNYFIRRAMLDEPIEIYGSGAQIRDYSYIDDVNDAFILAAQNDRANGEYFVIGSGEPIEFIDMAKLVIKTVGKGKIVHTPYPKGREEIDVKKFYVTNDKINILVGWHPTITLEEGLKKTVAFYREWLSEYIQMGDKI